jgi:hypothetical protein
MRTSSFAVIALVVLLAAFAVLLVSPHDRHSIASVPFWSSQR